MLLVVMSSVLFEMRRKVCGSCAESIKARIADHATGQKVVDDIKAGTKGGKITLVHMEMDSLASIKKGAEEILSQTKTINILINNAGVMATPEGKTKDGFETQFGTNQ